MVSGSVSTNTAPSPQLRSSSISPLFFLASACASASPIPEPALSVLLLPCTKGSNILPASRSSSPAPLSRTRTTAVPSSRHSSSQIVSRVNFMAFDIRLLITLKIASASTRHPTSSPGSSIRRSMFLARASYSYCAYTLRTIPLISVLSRLRINISSSIFLKSSS